MTRDFRASQIQSNKLIASGSTGTNADILFYDITSEDSSDPNKGLINPQAFNTGSIGKDIFLYVSGTVSSGSDTDKISVFGGSVRVSGNLVVDGNIGNTAETLQTTYDNSADAIVDLDSTQGAIQFRDTASGLGGDLFNVENSDGSERYLSIASGSTVISGTFNVRNNNSQTFNVNPNSTQISGANGVGIVTFNSKSDGPELAANNTLHVKTNGTNILTAKDSNSVNIFIVSQSQVFIPTGSSTSPGLSLEDNKSTGFFKGNNGNLHWQIGSNSSITEVSNQIEFEGEGSIYRININGLRRISGGDFFIRTVNPDDRLKLGTNNNKTLSLLHELDTNNNTAAGLVATSSVSNGENWTGFKVDVDSSSDSGSGTRLLADFQDTGASRVQITQDGKIHALTRNGGFYGKDTSTRTGFRPDDAFTPTAFILVSDDAVGQFRTNQVDLKVGGTISKHVFRNINGADTFGYNLRPATVNIGDGDGWTALQVNPDTTSDSGSGTRLLADFQDTGTSVARVRQDGSIFASSNTASEGFYFMGASNPVLATRVGDPGNLGKMELRIPDDGSSVLFATRDNNPRTIALAHEGGFDAVLLGVSTGFIGGSNWCTLNREADRDTGVLWPADDEVGFGAGGLTRLLCGVNSTQISGANGQGIATFQSGAFVLSGAMAYSDFATDVPPAKANHGQLFWSSTSGSLQLFAKDDSGKEQKLTNF